MVAQLITFNKIKEERLDKRRKQLSIATNIVKEKIHASKIYDKKIGLPTI